MDLSALYHMLRLELFHPKLFSFARDGPLPIMWKNHTTRPKPLQPLELEPLAGLTALIIGGTSGAGFQLAKILAAPCSCLIITARNPQRGQQAVEEILKSLPDDTIQQPQIDVWPLDMESFESIREFTKRLFLLSSLDIAVINAGLWHVQFSQSVDSFETHLQVNYLASCAISLSLLTVLGRDRSSPNSRPGRLLNVTSEGHSFEDVPTEKVARQVIDSFNDPKALSCYQRYTKSKLLSMIWTHELASSIDSSTSGVEIASFTPGATQTQILRDLGNGTVVRLMMGFFCQSAEEGAWTYIRALNAEQYHGRYFFRENAYKPADCVTAEKNKLFRQDLMQQTVAILEDHISIPSEIYQQLGISSGGGSPK